MSERDWHHEAQVAAETHLAAMMEAFDVECEGGEPDWPATAAGPFDGCDTCVIREVLAAAAPVLAEAGRHGETFT